MSLKFSHNWPILTIIILKICYRSFISNEGWIIIIIKLAKMYRFTKTNQLHVTMNTALNSDRIRWTLSNPQRLYWCHSADITTDIPHYRYHPTSVITQYNDVIMKHNDLHNTRLLNYEWRWQWPYHNGRTQIAAPHTKGHNAVQCKAS